MFYIARIYILGEVVWKKKLGKKNKRSDKMTSRIAPFYLNHNTSFQYENANLLPSQLFLNMIEKLTKKIHDDYFIAFTKSKKHLKLKGKITHDISYCVFRIEVYDANIVECSNREGCSILFINLFKFLKTDILFPPRDIFSISKSNCDFQYYLNLIDNTINHCNYVDVRFNFVSALLIVTKDCTHEQLSKVDSFKFKRILSLLLKSNDTNDVRLGLRFFKLIYLYIDNHHSFLCLMQKHLQLLIPSYQNMDFILEMYYFIKAILRQANAPCFF